MDWKRIQSRLGVTPDGKPGPITYRALLEYVAQRPLGPNKEVAHGCAEHFPAYQISTPLRIAHWIGQCAHETGGFRWLSEIWGPTPAQRRYEGRADLGNTQPGDGKRYLGRGCIQLTGRANYRAAGQRLGLDLERDPAIAGLPATSVLIACDYWRSRDMNALADQDRGEAITRKINGGTNGLHDRIAKTERAKGILL